MGLNIKRKESPSGQQELPLTPAKVEAKAATMEDVFGSDEPTRVRVQPLPRYAPAPGELHGIGVGQRVVIINDKFDWIKAYKPGDTGVVTRLHRQEDTARTYPTFDPTKDAVYEVVFDEPRTQKRMDFPRWAIEPITAVHRVGG